MGNIRLNCFVFEKMKEFELENSVKLMTGKVCMVTGATSGLGAATAEALAKEGAELIVVGRNEKKCKAIVRRIKRNTYSNKIEYLLADLSSQKDIRKLVDNLREKYQRLDVLINNAGAKIIKRQESVDGYEMTFALNHLGYFLLTNLLLDLLIASAPSRIINVSSGAHGAEINFEDLQCNKEYIGKKAYAQSKLANILFTYELARRLNGKKVYVNALDPGGVLTNFNKNNGLKFWIKHIAVHLLKGNLVGPKKGAETIIHLAVSSEIEGISSKYFLNKKSVQSSSTSYNKEIAKRLWEESAKMTGLLKVNNNKGQYHERI
jgi:NAD(P)-dependent dehydrogenase (short-subunit alcohol dehydrogenase family)